MDKRTAQKLVEDTFNDFFDEERFTLFAKNLLNDFEAKSNFYTGNLIWDDYKEHINTYKRIGKYIDPEGEALDVLLVEVKTVQKLERARTALRNFVIKHLSKFEKDYALVAFYSEEDKKADWRFSFIKLEHRSELDEAKGKVKAKKEFTPAKRYSFLVGKYEKSHTAQNQLAPLLQNISNNPTVEELEAAFSIEKVTDEFFSQYKDLYIKLYEHFENDSKVKTAIDATRIDTARFTKKLLGQIVFLYFLQKKGWLGVFKNERWGTGNKRFVQELYEQAQIEKINFFRDKLQYLFYEALAKERDNVNSYYKRFDCRIPFLNGGLFEADYDWQNANISIPESLFRNREKNRSGDEGTGVLDVFDRYNFTIKEDEPLDKEVAVDPEMLGKVFENMLEVAERKSKGAFYTPREIVHYMCQESLILYLDNSLEGKIERQDIEAFIREGHSYLENDINAIKKLEKVNADEQKTTEAEIRLPKSIRQNADLIDKRLSEILICDPAIGSGAFPLGLLHELVNAMLVLKPHLSYDYLTEKLKGFGFEHRESISSSRYTYRLKRHIIQESIYGVDIDASAIDIARLRLWLSLVVDEDDLDPIETLPNLDYKIVRGNSLIGLPAQGADRYPQVSNELEELKKKFYDETNETEKRNLRKNINKKIQDVLDTASHFEGYKIDFDFKLFFSEVWYNKKDKDDPKSERNGFDVLVGNPPYVRQELFKDYKNYLQANYKSIYDGRADLYTYFIKKGFDILCNSGVLTLITSNKFIVRGYGEKIRKLLSSEKTIKTIVNFGELPVFKASVDSLIIFAKNSYPKSDDSLIYAQATEENHINDINKFLSLNYVSKNLFSLNESWVFKDRQSMLILNRLNNFDQKLGTLIEIFGGIKTGCDRAFIINNRDRLNLIELDPNSEKLIKPWYRGRDIQKWCASPELFVIYIPQNEINIDDYAAIKNHLINYRDELEQRATNQKWFELQQPQRRFTALFESEKIIYSEIALEMRALLDKGKAYGTMKMFFIPYTPVVLAILNSSLFDWYARMNFSSLGDPWNGGRLEFKTIYMSKVPIPKTSNEDEMVFEEVIKYVTILKGIQRDVEYKFYNALLDGLVFELYFSAEIKSAGKEILRYLEDFRPITDEMNEEEKLAIIQSEFERLYNPNHPIRFALETLDSVEEVRIIKEALK